MKEIFIIKSPLGNLKLITENNTLKQLTYTAEKTSKKNQKEITQALSAYFKDANCKIATPLELQGTPFQKKVWQALQKIPMGHVMTYGELAKKLKTSPRAIGNACRANPIPIIVPCHRIVAKNHLGGYSGKQQGKMLNIKRWLLDHEKSSLSCHRR